MSEIRTTTLQDRSTVPVMDASHIETLQPPGRSRECETLDRLLAAAWAYQSQAMVIRGEHGIGKSTLLDYLAERATGCLVLRISGLQSERRLAYAALHQLCAPIMALSNQLPPPQQDALGRVFGLRGGETADGFVVAMAVMSLLTTAAAERPLICIVDDAQWLDDASAQVLGFVARRLKAMPVAVAIAVASAAGLRKELNLNGFRQLVVGGLPEPDARRLVQANIVGRLDERVLQRLAAECRGNPSVLRSVSANVRSAAVAGGFGVGSEPPRHLVDRFRSTLGALPTPTRQLVLLAAADPTGDAVLLWRAASNLGMDPAAAAPAASAGFVDFDQMVRFCHPWARPTVYHLASAKERRRAHGALAEATDPAEADRRAWHAALAAATGDRDAVAGLEQTVELAGHRGGLPAVAAFRSLAADLTVDPDGRTRRALLAAEVSYQAGDISASRRLLAVAQAGPIDTSSSARLRWLAARLSAPSDPGTHRSTLLLQAARDLEVRQPSIALSAYGEALESAMAGDSRTGVETVPTIAQSMLTGLLSTRPVAGTDLLLHGIATLVTRGHHAGAPLVLRALHLLDGLPSTDADHLQWLSLASRLAMAVWDDTGWHSLTTRLLADATSLSALTLLPRAVEAGVLVRLLSEGSAAAIDLLAQADRIDDVLGSRSAAYGRMVLAAWARPIPDESFVARSETRDPLDQHAVGGTTADWARAVSNNALGRYDLALAAATHGSDQEPVGLGSWCAIELVEAAVRAGSPERAEAAVDRVVTSADACATDWALGVKARCLALLGHDSAAEEHYQEAVDHLARTRVRAELGRAQLLYGEWLRRQGRRIDARVQLTAAYDAFTALGLDRFAERGRRELAATGATVRKRSVTHIETMTPQEALIARMAREGRTNAEIGTELFISARTVEWHLRKIFLKLGISSRRQLADALMV